MYEEIRFDFAPMEGITDYPYRSAHSRCFPGTDRYYSPFIAANQTCSMKTREKKDVAPEHNSGVVLVPQILTNHAEVFLWAVREMLDGGGVADVTDDRIVELVFEGVGYAQVPSAVGAFCGHEVHGAFLLFHNSFVAKGV